jgi:hypothetical protein
LLSLVFYSFSGGGKNQMKAILMTLLILLAPILPASSELLTPQEIESAIGSKLSYTKAEVKTLIAGILEIVEEELSTAQAEVVEKHEAKVQQLKDVCNFQITLIESERNFYKVMAWIELGVFLVGGVVWALTK